jgi:hypothetical protein
VERALSLAKEDHLLQEAVTLAVQDNN